MTISIRRAVLGDEAALARLNSVVQELHVAGEPERFKPAADAVVCSWFTDWLRRSTTKGWIAEAGGRPVGYITSEVRTRAETPFSPMRKWYEVDQVGVLPDFRFQGIGRALLDAVVSAAHADGVSELQLNTWTFNVEARLAFERLGFAPRELRLTKNISTPPLQGALSLCPAMTEFVVRPATPRDAEAACDVVRRSIRELCVEDHGNDEGKLTAWLANKTVPWFERIIASDRSPSVVAVDGKQVVGFAQINTDGRVALLYVAPGARFRGISRAMLSSLEERAMQLGLEKLRLESTKTAARFYEARGYRRTGDLHVGFAGLEAWPMEKMLKEPAEVGSRVYDSRPPYFDKLRSASTRRESLLCIGLDPDPKLIKGGLDGAVKLCRTLIETTSDLACSYKPNAAFWEQYGPRGWEGLAAVRQAVPPDIPVLLDCKRADVPNTMAAYAYAVFEAMDFDAATVHAYHGADSIAEFTKHDGRGVYVVCHTSNPGRADLQHLRCDDQPLYMAVAELAVRAGGTGKTGVVIGATAPTEASVVRAAFPELPFLLPGVGRQGGDVAASVRAAFTGDPASCLVAVVGAIMYADDPRAAAMSWRDRIRRVVDESLGTD